MATIPAAATDAEPTAADRQFVAEVMASPGLPADRMATIRERVKQRLVEQQTTMIVEATTPDA